MNNYLIETNDFLAFQKEKDKLIKEKDFLDATISIYDLEEKDIDLALEDLDTYSFLSTKKVIIITNIEVLKYDDNKKKLDHLFNYIKNPNLDNLLIIYSIGSNNLKTIKELKKLCECIEVNFNIKDYIKNTFKDYKIDFKAVNLLEEYCQGDFTKAVIECDKLKNYKGENKDITISDIEDIVTRKLGDPRDLTFAFSRSLAEKDKKTSLEKYRELLEYNIEPLSIIGLLASQIRIIYQVKLLEDKNMKDKEISEVLGEKEFRIKKTRELTRLYSKEELLRLMQELSDMDYRLKTEDIDGNNLIELFILNI